MLINPSLQVVGYTSIKYPISFIGYDINVILLIHLGGCFAPLSSVTLSVAKGLAPLIFFSGYLPECLFLKNLGFICLFPGEVKVISPEVAVGSRLPEDGTAQVKITDNSCRSEVKMLVN